MLPLHELGDRICILGPCCSGKSTLAVALARTLGTDALHLDLFRHRAGTDWQERPFADFQKLHDSAIGAPRWVIDGNYSQLLPQRLGRATGLILLHISTPRSLLRYLRRSLTPGMRLGALEGGRDSVKREMLRHIAITTRANRRGYAALLRALEMPKVFLAPVRQIETAYATWEL